VLHRCAVLAAAAGLALPLAACTSTPAATPGPRPSPDIGFEHVHGLGVDPADGMLYAATHYGLFRVPEVGEAERVAA
jgi:hypothetical protein